MQATISLNLPESAYHQLERVAEQQQRSITELVEAFAAEKAAPLLQPSIEAELAALPALSDQMLIKAAQPALTEAEQAELENLHFIAQRQADGLTDEQQTREATLMARYEHGVLLRSRALQLLKQRNVDTSSFYKKLA